MTETMQSGMAHCAMGVNVGQPSHTLCDPLDQATYLTHHLDLSAICRRFAYAHPNELNRIHAIQSEYRKFLVLKYVHGDRDNILFAAPRTIGQFWQLHALDTRSYYAMLDRLGMRISYDVDASVTDRATAHRRYLNTFDCYRDLFGVDPPAAVWSKCHGGDDDVEDVLSDIQEVARGGDSSVTAPDVNDGYGSTTSDWDNEGESEREWSDWKSESDTESVGGDQDGVLYPDPVLVAAREAYIHRFGTPATLSVVQYSGQGRTMHPLGDVLVGEFKEMYAGLCRYLCPHKLQFVLDGQLLKDSRYLMADYHVSNGTRLHLLVDRG
ncbi:hypothetical protein BCR44DRAFT_42155 [Catenaria anguillulae PL171]|uniref:Ubiquitin-like domain-containing protein n=1 Tax=Catenaria anguillulae PL171 TaxID=765915 RepID=A0A1Y2I0Y7_9FUNG|nr:hypothetical protein BCR44DRAFT_42155 [Catenaria anguillulae PL171]